MDQIKIGKFITEKRKVKNITQSKLAEMLGITDRAISKWETGICMPDAGTIPELCKILDISINDLFSGEVVNMKKYDKKLEENLLDMAKKEESSNKMLLLSMYVILIVSAIFYFGILFITGLFVYDENTQLIIILVSTVVFLLSAFVGLKFEVSAGYYKCKNCNHKFVPTYNQVLWAMHIGTTRYLKCPKCNKKSWSKKVMNKSG